EAHPADFFFGAGAHCRVRAAVDTPGAVATPVVVWQPGAGAGNHTGFGRARRAAQISHRTRPARRRRLREFPAWRPPLAAVAALGARLYRRGTRMGRAPGAQARRGARHEAGRAAAAGAGVLAGPAPARAGRRPRCTAGLRSAWPRRAAGGPASAQTGGDRVNHDMIYDGQRLNWPGHGTFRAASGLPGSQRAALACAADNGAVPPGYYRLYL